VEVEDMPSMLKVDDIAEYLRVPKSWVYERTRSGEIPVLKMGGHCRIPKDKFLAWVDGMDNRQEGVCRVHQFAV
jgi:excisionase family DNA binding protein